MTAFDTAGSTDINTSGTALTFDITAAAVGAWVYALLDIAASQGGDVTWTGWTKVLEADQAAASHYAWYRRKKQSGDTTFNITWAVTQKASLSWASFTGLKDDGPDELAQALTATTATQATPSLTPNGWDRWALCGFVNRSTTTGPLSWGSYATNGGGTLTERQDHCNATSRWAAVGLADTGAPVPRVAQSYSAKTQDTTPADSGANGAGLLLFLVPTPSGGSPHYDTVAPVGVPAVTEVASSGTTQAANVPAGVQVGEVLWADLTLSGGTVTHPTGWVEAASQLSPSFVKKYGAYKVWTAADVGTTSFTWTGITAATRLTIAMVRYPGVDLASVLDVAASTASQVAGVNNTLALPSINTATDGAALLGGVGDDSVTNPITPPGSMVKTAESSGTGKRSLLAYELAKVKGATGTRTFTFPTTNAHAGYLAALRPKTGGGVVGRAVLSGSGAAAGPEVHSGGGVLAARSAPSGAGSRTGLGGGGLAGRSSLSGSGLHVGLTSGTLVGRVYTSGQGFRPSGATETVRSGVIVEDRHGATGPALGGTVASAERRGSTRWQ